jgi:16S rRNA (adenine1518-N6/adenine1519-N6)-dimethyltransferase
MYAKKSFGQNFLKNADVAIHVADAANVNEGDSVLEVGPGKGMLTRVLLERGAFVIAVEKDPSLIPVLEKEFSRQIINGNLILIEGDILENAVIEEVFRNIPASYKIAANIPYFITGKLLRLFLGFKKQPQTIGLLVQKEVAQRVVARDKKESILSISVKVYGNPRYVQTVKAGNFSPAPKVDSAILGIEDISRDFFKDFSEEQFFKILRAGFAHKRKLLSGNLKNAFPGRQFDLSSLSANVRAEDLSLKDWREILIRANSH